MDTDRILETLNRHRVDYILIGGMNFWLRHAPLPTLDIDLWIDDNAANLQRCHNALVELDAEWGPSESEWRAVADWPPNWIARQYVFCLMSRCGPIDVFRSVAGLLSWSECRKRAELDTTPAGTAFVGLSDLDMIQCQLALPEGDRNLNRIRALQEICRESQEQRGPRE
jgi:hypothetical protein